MNGKWRVQETGARCVVRSLLQAPVAALALDGKRGEQRDAVRGENQKGNQPTIRGLG